MAHFHGTNGDDIYTGGGKADLIYGHDGDDRLSGRGGDDVILGGIGADSLYGGLGGDRLDGGAGDDLIKGAAGGDLLSGGQGSDALRGGGGDDNLNGGSGHDVLKGSGGDDFLDGGKGVDVLVGGKGADTFVFDALSVNSGRDQIRDFNVLEGDSISLVGIDADINQAGDQAFNVVNSLTGQSGQLTVHYDAEHDRTLIQGDTDGDGTADFSVTAKGLVTPIDFVL